MIAGIIKAAGLAWKALDLAGIGTKIVIVLAVVASIGAVYATWHFTIWSRGHDVGYADGLKDIARQDSKAIAKATQYRSVYRDCDARGMRWRQSTGECVRR